MPAVVRIIRLKCVVSDDATTDEIKVQQDGHQVWPGTGDAFHSISTGTSVDVGVHLTGDSRHGRRSGGRMSDRLEQVRSVVDSGHTPNPANGAPVLVRQAMMRHRY